VIKISVITVCFNSEHTIGDTINSVESQSHSSVEYIIVDGASKDGTMEIVKSHQDTIAKVVSEPDRGIYDAMNKGIALATGEVIGFINADDFYAAPDILALVANIFENPTIDACYGDLCYVRQNNPEITVRYWRSSKFEPRLFLTGWCPPHPTFFVRKSVYERFSSFDLSYKIAADMELMLRFLVTHQVRSVYLPRILVKMRMGGTTNRNIANVVKQNREIWRALREHGLRPSMALFLVGKLISRGKQFLLRPTSRI
jgi:glycosyltransferase involved in cell wall biosynthesis